MEKIERRKEQGRTEGTDSNSFWNSRLNKHRKRGEIKNIVTYSTCLHDQQDLCWGNTSRDTSEEPQEPNNLQNKVVFEFHQEQVSKINNINP